MIGRRLRAGILFYMALLALLAGPRPAAARQVQSEQNNLRITAVDTGDFPTVTVRVLTTAGGSAPVTDLDRLILREDGVPVTDTTLAQVPVGIDLALVIDANPDFLLFDDRSGLSRRDKVAASVARYAAQFMDPAGLDRVSVIVPDETGETASFLVQDATRPGELADAVNAYNPAPARITPLNDMLTTAISHLAASEDGRFRAILLYTDGARLDRQLDFPALVEAAQAAGIPIYAAILGAEASEEEVANVYRLYDPTNGLYRHMPEPEATDPIYEIFRDQGRQAQLAYRSPARQNGPHEVSVSLGNVRARSGFDLFLAAPEVSLEASRSLVRRAGSAPDTPLALLQPAVLPLTVRLDWPDGRPRPLTDLTFRVDGVPQPLAIEPAPDAAGQLPLPWDISSREAGTYRLEVEVADTFGFRAAAEPLEVTIEIARPSPPTPTPPPTRAPSPLETLSADASWWPLAALVLLAGAAATIFGVRRRTRRQTGEATTAQPTPPTAPARPADDSHVPVLEWVETGGDQIELAAPDVTLGREAGAVDIVVDDSTVSRLHARIRRAPTGDYWLYDEGSETGTFLNYDRLGLAPRRLQHGDTVQLGRVTLRFRLELPARPPSAPDPPTAAPPPTEES